MCVAYFHPGAQNEHDNYQRFWCIVHLKRAMGLATILVADFNKTPEEIRALGWLSLFQGRIQTPPVDFTCTSGSSRLIDYALVSHELQGLVKIKTSTVPWKPHTGIIVELLGNPLSVTALQHREPQGLPNLAALRQGKEFQEIVSFWGVGEG